MSTETENLHYNEGGLIVPIASNSKTELAMTVAAASEYLPRIKLCQGQAKEVQRRKVARGGNYALIKGKDDVVDLGEEVEMVVCSGRPKALQTGDVVISIFEPDSSEFQRIQAESKDKDSGCMFGPEFLVYLPEHETFATLFLSNPTGRREAGSVHARLGKGALLTSNLIETDKHSWFGPVCKDLTTPPTNLPTQEQFIEQIEKFNAEKSSTVKSADSPEGDDRER